MCIEKRTAAINERERWLIEEPDYKKNPETEYSGKINDLKKIEFPKPERKFLTQNLTITICIILLLVIGCGTITNNWVPLEKSNSTINLILGYLLGHYYKSS
jgi:hypothetical protein